jgi:hypothetical protein
MFAVLLFLNCLVIADFFPAGPWDELEVLGKVPL